MGMGVRNNIGGGGMGTNLPGPVNRDYQRGVRKKKREAVVWGRGECCPGKTGR